MKEGATNGLLFHALFAQVGLPDVTGGILILAIVGSLALLGILLCATSVIYRKPVLFIAGLASATPALALVGYFVWQERPQTRSWDFSASRSVAQMDKEPTYGRYYYQGNIDSTIRLPAGRQWTGKASLVTFQAEAGQVDSIYWDSQALSTEEAYQEARRILGELAIADVHGPPESKMYFHAETPPGSDPKVTLYLRRISPESEEAVWTVHVEVVWGSDVGWPRLGEVRR